MQIHHLFFDNGDFNVYTYECTKTKNGYSVTIPDRSGKRRVGMDEIMIVKEYEQYISSISYSVWVDDINKIDLAKSLIRNQMDKSILYTIKRIDYHKRILETLIGFAAKYDYTTKQT